MFDTMRKRKQVIYLFITAAMVLGMGFFGVGTAMRSADQRAGAVAVVNGEPILAKEVAQRVEAQERRVRQMLGDQAEAFLPQLNLRGRAMEEVIEEKLSLHEAKKMHIAVSDTELVSFISSQPYYQKDGKFDLDAYEKLPNRGDYEAQLREDLTNNKFHQYVYERIRLTPAEVKNSYLVKETKADVQYAKFNLEEAARKNKPTADKVKAALADKPALEKYFEEHKAEYITPASAQIKQIRVGVPFQASAEQKQAARKKIDAIATKATSANFSEVAKTDSDDEFAKKGGEVGWVDLSTREEPLRQAIEKLDPGQVSPVVETTFGYYLVKLEQKKPAAQKALADVQQTIAEKVATEKEATAWAKSTKETWEKQLAAGKPLDAELKKANIEIKKTGPFSLGQGYIPNLGKADAVLEAIFSLTPEKPIYPTLVEYQGDLYYVKLSTLEKAKPEELTKNQDSFDKSTASALQMELYKNWIEQAKKKATIVSNVKQAPQAQQVEME